MAFSNTEWAASVLPSPRGSNLENGPFPETRRPPSFAKSSRLNRGVPFNLGGHEK